MNLDDFDFEACYKNIKPLLVDIMKECEDAERDDFFLQLNVPIYKIINELCPSCLTSSYKLAMRRKIINIMIDIYQKDTGIRLQL